jgi:hypothetical protein
MRVGLKPAGRGTGGGAVATASARRGRVVDGPAANGPAEAPARPARQRAAPRGRRPQESRGQRSGPQTAPFARPVDRPTPPKTASQAKARAKARKAKAPKAIRLPLRDRLIARIPTVDLHPRTLIAKVPFVVLVIGSLAVGLAITLWLSTDAAERSYQLGAARAVNDALMQQKEALERDVLEAESAPALADAARNLGMIPSRDAAHLVQDPAGNWVVVGQPKPAEGVPPPPLNSKLPDEKPPAPPAPPAPATPAAGTRAEVPTRLNGRLPGSPEVPVVLPPVPNPFSAHAATGSALPGAAPLPGPAGDGTQGGLVLLPVAPPAVAVPPADPAPIAGPVAGAAPGALQ